MTLQASQCLEVHFTSVKNGHIVGVLSPQAVSRDVIEDSADQAVVRGKPFILFSYAW